MKRNLTLYLDGALIHRAKQAAAKDHVSLNAYIEKAIAETVSGDGQYEKAQQRALELLKEGLPIKTHGKPDWTREELHERT